MRDRSISKMSKIRDHCFFPEVAVKEDELAVSLIREAMLKYGKHSSNGRPNVITVSYEGLMQFQGAYLFDLYKQLGIQSSYLPNFEDANDKYVRGAEEYQLSLPKPKKPKEHLLPKRVLTVFGPESSGSTFLASTLGAAAGIIDGVVETIPRQATSLDGEWEVQHLSLPWGWLCEEGEDINIVETLVPEECFR